MPVAPIVAGSPLYGTLGGGNTTRSSSMASTPSCKVATVTVVLGAIGSPAIEAVTRADVIFWPAVIRTCHPPRYSAVTSSAFESTVVPTGRPACIGAPSGPVATSVTTWLAPGASSS